MGVKIEPRGDSINQTHTHTHTEQSAQHIHTAEVSSIQWEAEKQAGARGTVPLHCFTWAYIFSPLNQIQNPRINRMDLVKISHVLYSLLLVSNTMLKSCLTFMKDILLFSRKYTVNWVIQDNELSVRFNLL